MSDQRENIPQADQREAASQSSQQENSLQSDQRKAASQSDQQEIALENRQGNQTASQWQETDSIWNLKNMNKAVLLKKSLVAIVGIFIMAQGVSLFLMLEIGVDPISVFLDGMSKRLDITFGTAQTVLNVIMVAISLVFFRKNIGVSTVLALLFLGPFFDLIIMMESAFIHPGFSMIMKVLITVIAQAAFSLGVALYLSTNMGASPCDTPGVSISKMKNWDYGGVRMASDAAFFLFGLLLGGTIGIGTVCCVLCTGPVSQIFRPHCDRLITKLSVRR